MVRSTSLPQKIRLNTTWWQYSTVPLFEPKGKHSPTSRTFLRQDPDVILIGETRDPETAESSMDAAETGHLVFTTLRQQRISSLTRLMDMEVPSYKLNASLVAYSLSAC